MTLAYLGLYILLLAGIWGFFIVARIHAYKFKNMSTHIPYVCNGLFVCLLGFSILGFIMIILFANNTEQQTQSVEQFNEPDVQLERVSF